MIFTRKFKEYTDNELDAIKKIVDGNGYKVISKMAEILIHNTMIENLRVQPRAFDNPDRSIARQHERYQERIVTIKSFLKEMEIMAKESLKRDKKKK